jgi:hypothetical protein
MLGLTALRAWRLWLDLRAREIEAGRPKEPELEPAVRIEIAGHKEGLRRLEAIARGIDLRIGGTRRFAAGWSAAERPLGRLVEPLIF